MQDQEEQVEIVCGSSAAIRCETTINGRTCTDSVGGMCE